MSCFGINVIYLSPCNTLGKHLHRNSWHGLSWLYSYFWVGGDDIIGEYINIKKEYFFRVLCVSMITTAQGRCREGLIAMINLIQLSSSGNVRMT